MPFDPDKHHRRSIRLKGFDYAGAGLYFITICLHKHKCLFGRVENGTMILSEAGKVADLCWREIPSHFPHAVLHEYVIMPNHVHGIIELVKDGFVNENAMATGQPPCSQDSDDNPTGTKAFSPRDTIGSIVRGFKIGVTKWFRNAMPDEYPKGRPVWLRNYYDVVLWDRRSYEIRSNYIASNPANWRQDKWHAK